MKDYYVYAHYRESDKTLFYIGKGKKRRLNSLTGRSERWNNTVLKAGGFTSRKIYDGLSEHCAYAMEKILIEIFKDKLCNIATGGHGTSGMKFSEDSRRKVSKALTGRKVSDLVRSRFKELNSKKVIRSDGMIFNSVKDAAFFIKGYHCGSTRSNIAYCARGQTKNSMGFGWSYDLSKVPELHPRKGVRKKVKCIEKDLTFESIVDAVEWVKLTNGKACDYVISRAINENRLGYGFHWTEVK